MKGKERVGAVEDVAGGVIDVFAAESGAGGIVFIFGPHGSFALGLEAAEELTTTIRLAIERARDPR